MNNNSKESKALMIDYDAKQLVKDTELHLEPINYGIVEPMEEKAKNNQAPNYDGRDSLFNDHRHAIIASSDPYGLFAEVISEGKEYHCCNGELHVIHYDKGNDIWRIT